MKRAYITIKDIAKLCNVSPITVSRALSGKGYVHPETKKRILQTAYEVGYMRNCAATALRTNKTRTVGVIVADNSNPFYAEVVRGIEVAARQEGYAIFLMNTDRSYENEERAIRIMLERRVEGLIITAVQQRTDDLFKLSDLGVPYVVLGSKIEGLRTNFVYPDDLKVGRLIAEHLLSKERKNILFVNSLEYKFAARMRENGLREVIEGKANLIVERTIEGFQNAYETFAKVYKQLGNEKLDAVVCYNDMYAYAVLLYLKEEGIGVPDQISVVGVDDLPFSALLKPSLTTVRINKFALGYEAFNSLIYTIQTGQYTEKMIDVELVIRESA